MVTLSNKYCVLRFLLVPLSDWHYLRYICLVFLKKEDLVTHGSPFERF